MRDAIEPEVARARPRELHWASGDLRALVAVAVVLLFSSAACKQAAPDPSASPPPASPSPSASAPSASPSASSSATATASSTQANGSPSTGGNVLIALVELAAEDPSPGGTFLVIENRGATPADIGCWRVSTMTREDLRIPAGSTVPAGGGLRLFFERGAVANPDRLELRDTTGRLVDATPVLEDTAGDDQLFGRVGGEWRLDRPPLPSPMVDGEFIAPGGC